jgi:hypothetical protein
MQPEASLLRSLLPASRKSCLTLVTCGAVLHSEGLLAPRPSHELKDHPLSAVRAQLFQYIRIYPYLEVVSSPCVGWKDVVSSEMINACLWLQNVQCLIDHHM